MLKKLLGLWRDLLVEGKKQVVSRIVAAVFSSSVILAFVVWLRREIMASVTAFWLWLSNYSNVSNRLLCLLYLTAITLVVFFTLRLLFWYMRKSEPKWKRFRHMVMFDVGWYWDYRGTKMVNVRGVCQRPGCQGNIELDIHEHYSMSVDCCSCEFRARTRFNYRHQLMQHIAHQASQKIRQEGWAPSDFVVEFDY